MSSSNFKPFPRETGFVLKNCVEKKAEDYLQAIAAIVGVEKIKSFGRCRENFCVWVSDNDAAEELRILESVQVDNESVAIWPYFSPILPVKLFNVPPFISNEEIKLELLKWGSVKGDISSEKLHGVSEQFQNIESFTRVTHMSFKDDVRLPSRIAIKTPETTTSFSITTQVGRPKCFICADPKHKSKDCLKRKKKLPAPNLPDENEFPLSLGGGETKNNETQAMENGTVPMETSNNESSQVNPRKRTAISPLQSNPKPRKSEINPIIRTDWNFKLWRNGAGEAFSQAKAGVVHTFLGKLKNKDLISTDVTPFAPTGKDHKLALYHNIEYIVKAFGDSDPELKRDLKIVSDKIKKLIQ